MKLLWQLPAYIFIVFWPHLWNWSSPHEGMASSLAMDDNNNDTAITTHQQWEEYTSSSWPMDCRLGITFLLLVLMAMPVYNTVLFMIGKRHNRVIADHALLLSASYGEVSLSMPLGPPPPKPPLTMAPRPPPRRRRRRCAPLPPSEQQQEPEQQQPQILDPYQSLRKNLKRAHDGLQKPLPPPPIPAPLVWLPSSNEVVTPDIALRSPRKRWLKSRPKWLRLFLERFKRDKTQSHQLKVGDNNNGNGNGSSSSSNKNNKIISHLWAKLKPNRTDRKACHLYDEHIDTLSPSTSSSVSSSSSCFYV